MEDNESKGQVNPEKESLLDKARKLADKADDFIDENVEKLKQSEAFKSVTDAMDKAGNFVEDKIEDIKSGKTEEKIKEIKGKAEEEVKETLSKAKQKGKKLASKAADKLEDIAENIRKKTGVNQPPENPGQ